MFDWVIRHTLVPLILRWGLAAVFIFHGIHKVADQGNQWGANWMPAPQAQQGDKVEFNWSDIQDWAKEPKLPLPAAVQMLVAWTELCCGIALALGFLTRLAALGIIALMAGAIYTVHGQHGFDTTKGGYEYNFALIVMAVAVVLLGGGTLAVDRIFRFRRKTVVVEQQRVVQPVAPAPPTRRL